MDELARVKQERMREQAEEQADTVVNKILRNVSKDTVIHVQWLENHERGAKIRAGIYSFHIPFYDVVRMAIHKLRRHGYTVREYGY